MRFVTTLTTILFMLIVQFSIAQNLVPNPGFEEVTRCPQNFSADRFDFILPGWTSPTRGTPDHFHACSWGDADVPYNWAGISNANTGNGYAGIYVWQNELARNYREYIQCELAEPLVTGKRYQIQFYFKLASYALYSVNRIGLTLTTERIHVQHDVELSLEPILSVEKDSAITATTGGWELATMEYTANGGERFVIIGNFFKNSETKSQRIPGRISKSRMLTFNSYYYIDDVSVICLDTLDYNKVIPTKFGIDTVEVNKDYVLQNIQFEFDSYILVRSSFRELDKVVTYLNENKNLHIRLSGHTDFIGDDAYNLTLSRNRARSVADYLISKGIDTRRIITYGFGKVRPLIDEQTDEARKINRRVEIRFVIP